jgi:hypothetical protein
MAKSPNLNFLIYGIILLIAIIVDAIGAWYATVIKSLAIKEGFETKEGLAFLSNDKDNDCPISAQRQPDSRILVQPQNRSFDSMSDYVIWLSSLSAAGSVCVPPYVKGTREVEMIQSSNSPDPNEGNKPNSTNPEDGAKSKNVFTKQVEGEQTSAKTPINRMDDYEYSRVFQSESSPRNEIAKASVNSLMAKNQFDWAQLPFNSQKRDDEETEFISGRLDDAFREPKTGVFFRNMEGFTVNPPDLDGQDRAEKAVLEGFTAKPAESLTEHTVEDVAELVKKMYSDDPEWEPVVEKVSEHEYRVIELRPKPKKEAYKNEDEPETVERSKEMGMISAEVEIEGGSSKDPYFDKQGVVDYGNDRFFEYKDFKKWTPGLERMFAPTLNQTNWS